MVVKTDFGQKGVGQKVWLKKCGGSKNVLVSKIFCQKDCGQINLWSKTFLSKNKREKMLVLKNWSKKLW